jgi:hypothetical protein
MLFHFKYKKGILKNIHTIPPIFRKLTSDYKKGRSAYFYCSMTRYDTYTLDIVDDDINVDNLLLLLNIIFKLP